MNNEYKYYTIHYKYYNPHIGEYQLHISQCLSKSINDAILEIRKNEYYHSIIIDKVIISDIDGINHKIIDYCMKEYPAYQSCGPC